MRTARSLAIDSLPIKYWQAVSSSGQAAYTVMNANDAVSLCTGVVYSDTIHSDTIRTLVSADDRAYESTLCSFAYLRLHKTEMHRLPVEHHSISEPEAAGAVS